MPLLLALLLSSQGVSPRAVSFHVPRDLEKRIASRPATPLDLGGWRANRIESANFLVFSSCDEAFFRGVTLRLERLFAAYEALFDVKPKERRKVKLFLLADGKEYAAFQKKQFGNAVANPAFYAPGAGLLIAHDVAADAKKTLGPLRAEIERLEGKDPKPAARIDELGKGLRHNEGVARELDARMFRMLHYEAFHAFADLYLFEGGAGAAPRWLDEGLGTYFETSVLEKSRFRHGGTHGDLVARLKQAIGKGTLAPWDSIFSGGEEMFQVRPGEDRARSELAYGQCWSMVHYLMGRRSPKEVIGFAGDVRSGTPAAKALEKLARKPFARVVADWSRYVRGMR